MVGAALSPLRRLYAISEHEPKEPVTMVGLDEIGALRDGHMA